MFYQGVKTCVLIQKCAAQIKNQTKLRKVVLNVVKAAWITRKVQQMGQLQGKMYTFSLHENLWKTFSIMFTCTENEEKIYSLERGYRGYHVQIYNSHPFAETSPRGQRIPSD